ncbi:MAG: hypothetical protein DMG12_25650 [Acidobacteria bacterium]|nr:MAG: hypothetical protein DMG12_25650 [Acidobacteriota bacterium]
MCAFKRGFLCRSKSLNGHEWLARKLKANGVCYAKLDNAFLWIEDMARAQLFADRFAKLNWPKILNKYAPRVISIKREYVTPRCPTAAIGPIAIFPCGTLYTSYPSAGVRRYR